MHPLKPYTFLKTNHRCILCLITADHIAKQPPIFLPLSLMTAGQSSANQFSDQHFEMRLEKHN